MKEKILLALEGLEMEIEDVQDNIWNNVPWIDEMMDHVGMRSGLVRVEAEADSYIMGVYFSSKLDQSIILDWEFREQFESLDELADAIVALETNGMAMEHALDDSPELFTQKLKAMNHVRESKGQDQEPER